MALRIISGITNFLRVALGVLIFVWAISWTYRIYRLFRYNEWSSGFGEKHEMLSKSRSWILGLILIPIILFFYLIAFLIISKIDLLKICFPTFFNSLNK